MKKYEEDRYLFENIKDHIYPWVKKELTDPKALNGKGISEKIHRWCHLSAICRLYLL